MKSFTTEKSELINIKNLLQSTSQWHAPDLLLTGIKGVGKTVFLKKLKREMDSEYLVVHIDFSKSKYYQINYINKKSNIFATHSLNEKIEKFREIKFPHYIFHPTIEDF